VKAQNLTAKEKEKYFISLYVKEGATDEKIPDAERRASLKPGTGQTILKRKKVQKDIKSRMEPLRLEQIHQKLLGDASAVAHEALQNGLTNKVANICGHKIDVDEVLDHELMRMVVGLDQNKHPKAKLEAIITGYVVIGTLEGNSMRRVSPSETINSQASSGIYTSLFARLAYQQTQTQEGSQQERDEAADLFSEPKQSQIVPDTPIQAADKSIDDPPTQTINHPRVITVEIE
jgi:hypothetical protein